MFVFSWFRVASLLVVLSLMEDFRVHLTITPLTSCMNYVEESQISDFEKSTVLRTKGDWRRV